jgi:hypothetical protein
MPGLNCKGPDGLGAMSGRRMGKGKPENKGKSAEEIMNERKFFSTNNVEPFFGGGRGKGIGKMQGQGQGKGNGSGRRMRNGIK